MQQYYYHVYIKGRNASGKRIERFNYGFEPLFLQKRVVEPYNNNKPFMFLGDRILPSEIEIIHIFQSTEHGEETVLPNGKLLSDEDNLEYVVKCFLEAKIPSIKGDLSTILLVPPTGKQVLPLGDKTKIFIVHGADHKALKELKSILEEAGLIPIILREQPSGSMTIIEKLEKCSEDIGFAFVLLTPDDALVPTEQGFRINEKQGIVTPLFWYNSKPVFRARQNVLLEFGYFIAKIGREKVVCLYRESIELPFDKPSDMHGVVYTSFKESINEVKETILKELEAAGYKLKKK